MWIYVVTSFTRYSKVGRKAEKDFCRALMRDGFQCLHANLHVRYCTSSSNALMHKERVKRLLPSKGCDISIILSADNVEQNTYHCLLRKRKQRPDLTKPSLLEFF